MRWEPAEYLRFGDQRARPFTDLMARVWAEDPAYIVDLGCGPGTLTRTLRQRWPQADVHGVDSSPEMIDRARDEDAHEGTVNDVRFSLADLRTWVPERPVDVLTCNATLQWVPGHLDLIDRLVSMLVPGGWFAFQVPGNSGAASHTELAALIRSPRWQPVLAAHDLPEPAAVEPADYVDRLIKLGCRVDAWETTYLHVLDGDEAVLKWMTGTAMRPVLSVLSTTDRAEFNAEYGERLRVAYPQHDYGTLLPYRRIFAVAQATGTARRDEPSSF